MSYLEGAIVTLGLITLAAIIEYNWPGTPAFGAVVGLAFVVGTLVRKPGNR
jgi:hypothetical protein